MPLKGRVYLASVGHTQHQDLRNLRTQEEAAKVDTIEWPASGCKKGRGRHRSSHHWEGWEAVGRAGEGAHLEKLLSIDEARVVIVEDFEGKRARHRRDLRAHGVEEAVKLVGVELAVAIQVEQREGGEECAVLLNLLLEDHKTVLPLVPARRRRQE